MAENYEVIALTRRQSQCLDLVNRGLTSKEIARELGLSPSTVDNHLREAIVRMGKNNRHEAARAFAMAPSAADAASHFRTSQAPRGASLLRVDDFGSFAVFICKN